MADAHGGGVVVIDEVQKLPSLLDEAHRLLEAASFSHGGVLNMQAIATDCGINRKTIENHFDLLEDLLLSVRLPVFARRAKRKLTSHPKFYFVDAGIYRAIRPRGPLDTDEEVDGAAIETLVLEALRAENANHDFGYAIFFWRTTDQKEVDFVLYGERGLHAFEVKRASRSKRADRSGSCANASGRILSATSRPSVRSWARYTTPMPPSPRRAVISYAPRRRPMGVAPGPSGTGYVRK